MGDHMAIACVAFAVFSEMKMPLKGMRAFAAGMVLCVAVGEFVTGILGR